MNTYEVSYAKYLRTLPRREKKRERSARYYREVTKLKRAQGKLIGYWPVTCSLLGRT
jgi:hypothetical protein